MASSPSSFANNNNNTNRMTPTTFVFTPSMTNTTNIRPTVTSNGTMLQPISTGMISAQTNIVRLNQPTSQFVPQTVWTNANTPGSPRLQFSSAIKTEPITSPVSQPQTTTIVPNKIVPHPVVRQTVPTAQTPKFTEQQIMDFVAKCRTFLITLLKLAEKQAPEKLPMVRQCIQDLLDGTISPESFTERLHSLYKSQPHVSLVPFFKLALPHMRQIVKNTYGQSISIELLEKLNLPSSSSTATRPPTTTASTTNASCVVVNPSLLSQTSSSTGQQPVLYTTVQPQQKINLLQATPNTPTLIGSTTSLLSQQQQQQQQARAQINIAGIRPIITSVTPSSNGNLLNPQQPTTTIQAVTQTIIPQSDSLLQRTFLTSTPTSSQAPQIITVNPQAIKTEITSIHQPTIISALQPSTHNQQIHLKPTIKSEDESSDEHPSPVKASATADDRHTQHITHEKRFLSSHILRRRFDHFLKNDSRWEGGAIGIHDDAVLAMISHAAEERIKNLIEKIKSVVQQRMLLSNHNSNSGGQDHDTHSQMEQNGEEQQNNSRRSLSSIQKSKNRKRKLTSSKRLDPANVRDVLVMMETDRHLRRSALYLKTLDKFC